MKKVLIIEHDLRHRRPLTAWLEGEGFNPMTADNGAVGVMLAKHYQPDIVLCYDRTPVMDGIETLRSLRNDPTTAHIPCYFLTSEGDIDHFFEALGAGVDGFLKRPVNVQELRHVLRALVLKTPSVSLMD